MTTPKLLLADDSATIRKVVELTFADEGIDVFAVGDGDAAMIKFVEVQPDIVLVDVEMPGLSGYQICEMIKQDEATKHIPVLLLVGSFEPFDHDEAERSGADGFMTKPFHSIRELVARVSELLGTDAPPQAVGPETDDISELYNSSFAETLPIQEYDTEEDPFSEAVMDDAMIDAFHPVGPDGENGEAELVFGLDAQKLVKDFDWSPAAKIVDGFGPDQPQTDFEPRFSFADNEPNDTDHLPRKDESVFAAADKTDAEPSDELVSLIANRVIDRLSDRVIREIAQEAVPRIAEKLIREALEDDKKA